MKIRKLIVLVLMIFILWGCAKNISVDTSIKQIDFKIYSGGKIVSNNITDKNKIKNVLNLLDKCTDKGKIINGRDKFDLPKGDSYKIILNKTDEYIEYDFISGYVVYNSLVYDIVDDYISIINKIKNLFEI